MSLDSEWTENLDKLEGTTLIDVLPNDNKDLMARLIKAIKDRAKLPCDMDCPETDTAVEEVNNYAQKLYELFCEGASIADDLMIGEQVAKAHHDSMDEKGETMSAYDMQVFCGHKPGDF